MTPFAAAYETLADEARAWLARKGSHSRPSRCRRFAELRYAGQAYELTDAGPAKDRIDVSVATSFHAEHERTYGHGSDADPGRYRVDPRASPASSGRAVVEPTCPPSERTAPTGEPSSGNAYFGRDVGFIDTPVIRARRAHEGVARGPADRRGIRRDLRRPARCTRALDALGNIEIDVRLSR